MQIYPVSYTHLDVYKRQVLPQQFHHLVELLLAHVLGAGEDDGAGGLDLVVEEFPEVLHIQLALLGLSLIHI